MTVGVLESAAKRTHRIVFSVSPRTVKTLNNVSVQSSARYNTHNRHLREPMTEFTGLDSDRCTFDMTLSRFLGVVPHIDLQMLRILLERGEVIRFMLGRDLMGRTGLWTLQSFDVGVENYDADGTLLSVTVRVTLLGYSRR